MMGFEAYYTTVADEPGLVDEFLDRIEPHALAVSKAITAYRPDAVCLPAFAAGKGGLLMSREWTERFVCSRLAKQMSVFADAGIPVIIHSDGDNRDLMPRWIELGVAAWHPVESRRTATRSTTTSNGGAIESRSAATLTAPGC